MADAFNVYCDESCHPQNADQQSMTLGAIVCPVEKTREIAIDIRHIKQQYKLSPSFEIKWSKVSPAQQTFYLDLVNYFFDRQDLYFRALIVPDKPRLHNHTSRQDYDAWYYQMYFELLKPLFISEAEYNIYLDIKDTKSSESTRKLHNELCDNINDAEYKIIKKIQTIRSHEVEQMQLADFLIGIIGYANRGLTTSTTKLALTEKMRSRSSYSLTQTTPPDAHKMKLRLWQER
jgi:hypothetical protein